MNTEKNISVDQELDLLNSLMPTKHNICHTSVYGKLFDSVQDSRTEAEYKMKLVLLQLANRGAVDLSIDSVTGEILAQKSFVS